MKKKSQKGNIFFSKKLFVGTIKEIERQYRHDLECSDAFRIILPHDYVGGYDNHWLQNQLTKVVQIAMDDEHKDSWIEYYMWELDFGKKFTDGCVTMQDGTPADLSNAGKLWEFLTTKN